MAGGGSDRHRRVEKGSSSFPYNLLSFDNTLSFDDNNDDDDASDEVHDLDSIVPSSDPSALSLFSDSSDSASLPAENLPLLL